MVTVDTARSLPPFEQIRSQYAGQIATGELAPGTRLPTVRQLATELGVAVNTVARAYRELESAGLVETRGRAGTCVSSRGQAATAAAVAAARVYAERTAALGLDPAQALDIVAAALRG
jgi:DNA-binding transcriptional regulator YhcF (GntR family)